MTAKDLSTQAGSAITEAGLRNNIQVGSSTSAPGRDGNGCVPIFNLMEDAATAEISRSQVWQWNALAQGVLADGRKVNPGAFPRDSSTS